jgi:hypothetical protein
MPKNQDTTSVKINRIEMSHDRDKLKAYQNRTDGYGAKFDNRYGDRRQTTRERRNEYDSWKD